MGKLRTSIETVTKTATVLEKAVETLLDTREKETNNFMHMTDLCRGGAEVMYMYLMEKYKKEGKKIEAQHKDTIKDVLDPKLATLIKGMADSQAKVVKLMEERDKTQRVGTEIKTKAQALRKDLTDIQKVIDKKRKGWLLSSKYKSKLKGYEDSLAALDKALEGVEKAMPGRNYGKSIDPSQWKFTAATTVGHIKEVSSRYLDMDIKMTKTEDEEQAKKFRGRGFGNSLEGLKKWAAEADEMEKVD